MALFVAGLVVMLLGMLVAAVGYVWLLIVTFRESFILGIFTIFWPLSFWMGPENVVDEDFRTPVAAWILLGGVATIAVGAGLAWWATPA